MRDSREKANAKKLGIADLASQTAEHAELCFSMLERVPNTKTQIQSSLDTISRRIACAQEDINENNGLSADMAANESSNDEVAEGNNVVYVAAWQVVKLSSANYMYLPKLLQAILISVINTVTIPICLLLNVILHSLE